MVSQGCNRHRSHPGHDSGSQGSFEQNWAGIEVASLDDAVHPDRSQGKAEVHYRDHQRKERVLRRGKHPGEDQVRSGKAQSRRPVYDRAPERGRVPQTPHALAPEAFDSIMV